MKPTKDINSLLPSIRAALFAQQRSMTVPAQPSAATAIPFVTVSADVLGARPRPRDAQAVSDVTGITGGSTNTSGMCGKPPRAGVCAGHT